MFKFQLPDDSAQEYQIRRILLWRLDNIEINQSVQAMHARAGPQPLNDEFLCLSSTMSSLNDVYQGQHHGNRILPLGRTIEKLEHTCFVAQGPVTVRDLLGNLTEEHGILLFHPAPGLDGLAVVSLLGLDFAEQYACTDTVMVARQRLLKTSSGRGIIPSA